ncbi:MAG: hypothetical protein OHK0022_11810 [Roseiflexaceae bacterium]
MTIPPSKTGRDVGRQESGAPPLVLDQAGTVDPQQSPFPLTDLQQAYWIGQTDLMELGNLYAHIYTEVEFHDLDLTRLALVVQRLVERHPTLRSVILPDGTQQVLSAPPPFTIACTDLRGQSAEVAEAHLAALRNELGQNGPRTDTWPLWDVRASLLGQGRTRLHLSISLQLVDGRSMAILSAEALRLYQDPGATLPPLEMTFRDAVLELEAAKQNTLYQKSLAYWRQRLTTLPAGPELPLVRQPAELRSTRFVSRSARLDGPTWQRLKERAARCGLRSPVAAIYSAYAEVLAGWSRTAHFCFTLLFAHRLSQQTRARGVVGNLSTTILVEVDQRTPETFANRAKQFERQLWQSMAHGDVCGVEIIRELTRQQGWSNKASVPVAFVSTVGLSSPQHKGMFMGTEEQGRVVYYCVQTPQVYLDHQIYETGDGLRLEWDMVDELFPEGLPEAMFGAYVRLLQELADSDARWQTAGAGLAPPEHIARYQAVNATAAPLPSGLLHTRFAEQARRRPDQLGVISPRRSLSYAEIERGSAALGGHLVGLGVRPNQLVAVVMEKGWEQVVAALGILYAGAAYLPIDPALPQERLWHLLKHGQVAHVLTQPWIDDRLTWPSTVRRHRVDEGCLREQPAPAVPMLPHPDDLAYVIYTSGSTGQPKGVMISHQGALNTLDDINQRFGITPDDRVLALSSLSFDLSVYDLFGLLAVGGALVLPDAARSLDPAHWLELLAEHRVTVWNSVPALIDILVDYVGDQHDLWPRSLRLAMLSGDWIPLRLPERLQALHDQLRVVSLGGATEASIWSIFYPIDRVDPAWKSIPYGYPLLNQQLMVLDTSLNPRPFWVPGHLYIGGVGLAKGYWNDPAKTDASFLTHPQTGERLYRTGDLGRFWPDGTIEFLGREDFQVKVQGHRIELGEIEVVLGQHPAVREAIATVESNWRGERRLVAYVVSQPGAQPSAAELMEHLRRLLPPYMQPAALGFLEALPLSANGKVNRQALPPLDGQEQPVPEGQAPRDPVERHLVALWEQTLGRSPIGIHDNFFELGGNSLAALRLMVRIRQEFQHDLPLSMLFEGASVAALAEVLRRATGPVAAGRSPLVVIRRNGSRPPLFWVHPVGGGVLCYAELARQLPDHPFYALEAPGLHGQARPLEDVAAMAAVYAAAIQSVQPDGPYLLGGWSMGGLIAYEIAQQLAAAERLIGLVVLIDSEVPTPEQRGQPLSPTDILAWFAQDLWSSAGRRADFPLAGLRAQPPAEQAAFVLACSKQAGVLGPEVDLAQLLRLLEVFSANTRALLAYQPRPASFPTALFSASATEAALGAGPALGWEPYAGPQLTIHPIDADHYSLIGLPTVVELARQIRQLIITPSLAS